MPQIFIVLYSLKLSHRKDARHGSETRGTGLAVLAVVKIMIRPEIWDFGTTVLLLLMWGFLKLKKDTLESFWKWY